MSSRTRLSPIKGKREIAKLKIGLDVSDTSLILPVIEDSKIELPDFMAVFG